MAEQVMERVAVVIPALNAARGGTWQACLEAVARQRMQPGKRLVIDSASEDETVAMARAAGWEVRQIARADFNHGATRQAVVAELAQAGFEVVVMMTQDALLQGEEALGTLVEALARTGAACAYGRQVGRASPVRSLEALQRSRCYPAESAVKTRAEIGRLGLSACFCSDAFCAWSLAKLQAVGGFPRTDFGEDMLAAAKLLLAGESVAYCAEAVVEHEHAVRLGALFARGEAIARLHRANPWLRERFGRPEARAAALLGRGLTWALVPQLAAKYAGYRWGLACSVFARPWAVWAVAGALTVPALAVSVVWKGYAYDVLSRYAPMAEYFAKGEWAYAFHPRFGVLFQALAGSVTWATGCDGLQACVWVSLAVWGLCMPFLFEVAERVFSRAVAWMTVALYALCWPLLFDGFCGLRDSLRTLALLLVAAGMLRKLERERALPYLLPGLFILCTVRGDTVAMALAAVGLYACFDRFRWRTWALAAWTALALQPCCWLVWSWTGVWLPAAQYAKLWLKFWGA